MSLNTTGMLSILSSTSSIESVVVDWLSSYKVSKEKGILSLVQMLLDLSGCRETISENTLKKTANWEEILQNMKQQIELDKIPLIEVKRNQIRLAVFFQLMIQKSEHLIFDDYLLNPLLRIIGCMSLQKMRVFRFIGTLSALKITTALVNVHLVVRKNLFMIQKQLLSEESEEYPLKSSFRIESLETQRNEYRKKDHYLRDIIQDCVKSIFKMRVRDVMSEIAALCINEMSVWMLMNPDMFLNDNFLDYFYFLLQHENEEVQKACLNSLNLLCNENKYSELKKFILRSKDLLMSLIFDTSTEVSVLVIIFLTKVVTTFGIKIFEQRPEDVFLLVFSHNVAFADAAGEFLLAWINAILKNTPETERRVGNHVAILVSLATFIMESKFPWHSVLLVDSLFDHCDALKDWESMNVALLDVSQEGPLESSLLQLVATAVHMACTGQSPRPDRKKGKVNWKQLDRERKHSEEVTRHLAAGLPRLLLRHRCDADNVWNLLEIAKHFSAEKISTNYDYYVRCMVKKMKILIEIHTDERVLKGCCEVMDNFLYRNETNTSTHSIVWESVFDDLVSNTKCHLENIYKMFEEGRKPHTDSLCTLNNSLRKLVVINVSHQLKLESLWNLTYQLLNKCPKIYVVPEVIIMNCINVCNLILLEEASTMHRENINKGKVQSQENKLLNFFNTLSLFLKNTMKKMERFTLVVLCNLLIVYFSKCDGHPSLYTVDIPSNIFLYFKKYIETLLRTTRESTSNDVVQFKKEALKLFGTAIRNRALNLDAGACIFNYFDDRDKDVREIMRQNIEDMVKIDHIKSVENIMKVVSVNFRSLFKIGDDPTGIKENICYWIKLFYDPLRNHPPALQYFHSLCLRLATELMEKKKPYLPLLEVLAAFVQGLSSRECSSLLSALEESFPHRSRSVAVYKAALLQRAVMAPGTVRRGDKVRISPRATDSEISSAESSKKRRGLRSPLRNEEDSSKKRRRLL